MNPTEIIQAAFLGVVQGLTEFIPVSSSGHLEIIPRLFGWEDLSSSLIFCAHFGTLMALVIYFRKDLWEYAKVLLKFVKRKNEEEDKPTLNLLRNVVIATIPAAVLGLIANELIESFYDGSVYSQLAQIATLVAMGVLGVIFILSDEWFDGDKVKLEKFPAKFAFLVGSAQALAFIRGVSRSGITLITAQAAGLSRTDAAKFSFLISIPIITAISLLGMYDLTKLPSAEITQTLPQAIAILVASFVSGFFAIGYLLDYLKSNGLAFFGWYRIIFAILAALLLFS